MEIDLRRLIRHLGRDTNAPSGKSHLFGVYIRQRDHNELTGHLTFVLTPIFKEDTTLRKTVEEAYLLAAEYHHTFSNRDDQPEFMSIFIKSGERLRGSDCPMVVMSYGNQQVRTREGWGEDPEWNEEEDFYRDEEEVEELMIDILDFETGEWVEKAALNVKELVRFQFEHGRPWTGNVDIQFQDREVGGKILLEVDFLSSPVRYQICSWSRLMTSVR